MSIEFVVESGTGASTSTSYCTVAQFKQYWENKGLPYCESDVTIEGWLNQATEYIDLNYNFEGQPSLDTQALEWPRLYAMDRLGYYISAGTIPKEIINATCYLAAQCKTGVLSTVDNGVKSESYGPVSVTYSKTSGREFTAVDKMLKNLLLFGNPLHRAN
jgi:hypothetical protein